MHPFDVITSKTRWQNNFFPVLPTLARNSTSFYFKDTSSKWIKRLPNIWATIVREFVNRAFQKWPNLVTLVVTYVLDVVEVEWRALAGVLDRLCREGLVFAIDEAGRN